MTAGAEPTALARLEDYDEGRYNVLHPVVQVDESGLAHSEMLVQSISVRMLSPERGYTYNSPTYANERKGEHALSGLALKAIASDAGIRWLEVGIVEDDQRLSPGHRYLRVRSTGAVLQPNGELYVVTQHKEIDTEVLAAQIEERARKAGRLNEDEIAVKVRSEVLQVREHQLALAETKSQLRVIRALLSLKQVYKTQELKKPFVIPRLLVRPDLTDPLQAERVQVEGRRAAAELYGAPTTTHVDDAGVAPAAALPPSDTTTSAPPAGTAVEAPADHGTTQAARSNEAAPSGRARTRSTKGSGETPDAAGAEEAATSTGAEEKAAPVDGGPQAPAEDIVLTRAPHEGKPISQVALDDPEFLKRVLTDGRTSEANKALARAWLEWTIPGSTEGL